MTDQQRRAGFGSRWPLRARIIAILTAVLSATMFTVGMYSSWQLREHLLQREDAELVAAAPTLAAATIQQEKSQETAQVPSSLPANDYAVRIVANHTYDVRPRTGPDPDFGIVSPQTAKAQAGKPYTTGSSANGGTQWRVVQGIDESTGNAYAVAVSLRTTQSIIRQMQVLTIIVSIVTLLVAITLGLIGIRRALRPLRDIEDTAAAIAAGDLSRRVPDPGSRDEIASLSESLNVMLTRLERSMEVKDQSEESMRRFVADASHELRTPLATVRGYAELYRQGAVTNPDDVAAGFRRIEDEARRMSAMVEDLLLLSRLETEERAASKDSATVGRTVRDVDLTVLAADAAEDARVREADASDQRSIRVLGLDGPLAPVVVSGDEQRLRQVVTNLLTNAERYTPAGSPIEIAVGQDDASGILHVIDHGPGIPEDVRPRVFNRFYRADVARNRAAGSTGLGLSIVAAIVKAHEGTVSVHDTPGGGATFEVTLPLNPNSDLLD